MSTRCRSTFRISDCKFKSHIHIPHSFTGPGEALPMTSRSCRTSARIFCTCNCPKKNGAKMAMRTCAMPPLPRLPAVEAKSCKPEGGNHIISSAFRVPVCFLTHTYSNSFLFFPFKYLHLSSQKYLYLEINPYFNPQSTKIESVHSTSIQPLKPIIHIYIILISCLLQLI